MQVYFNQHKFAKIWLFFEALECSNNTQFWGISWHVNGKYLICKGRCENKFLTCTNKSQPSLTSVPENWTGVKWTVLWPAPGYCSPDSTPGVDSVFGMHKHPSCGLDTNARHLAFLRHKLSLKNLRFLLCHQYVFIWVVSSHESKHSWSPALPATVISDYELYYEMAESTERGKTLIDATAFLVDTVLPKKSLLPPESIWSSEEFPLKGCKITGTCASRVHTKHDQTLFDCLFSSSQVFFQSLSPQTD